MMWLLLFGTMYALSIAGTVWSFVTAPELEWHQ